MAPSARPPGQLSTTLGRVGGAGILTAFALATGVLAAAPPAPAQVSLPAQASALAAELEDEVDAALALLGPLRGRLRAGETPDWKVFDDLVARSPMRRPAQELVAWVPRVTAAARASFEADSGRDAFRTLRIVEPGRGQKAGEPGDAALVAAQPRAHHHPVALAAPLQPASELLGLDLEALPELELALSRPPRDGRPTIAGPLTLLPAASCAAESARTGCTPQIFVVVPLSSASSRAPGGFLLVGLSWPAITRAAFGRVASAPRRPLDLLEPRAARALFHVQRTPFSLELRAEPGRPLTARLGHAQSDAQTQ
jgi:CHASE1-domain containing sensor protein